MGSPLEIGTEPGKAAPAEYGPRALLTASGLVIMRDPTTLLPAAKYPPGYLLLNDLGRTYTGDGATTPEASLLSGNAGNANVASANLFPASAAIGDSFDLILRGTVLNNTGAGAKTTINIYHGAYQLMSQQSNTLTTNATARIWGVHLRVSTEVVGGVNVAKVRLVGERWGLNASTLQGVGIGWQPVVSNSWDINDGASSGTDANLATNATRDFNVTATHTVNSASMSTKLNLAQILWIPKNT